MAKDSKVIADASQRDGSAVMVLAAVTILLLPGTFVAVSALLLSTSTFDRAGLGHSNISIVIPRNPSLRLECNRKRPSRQLPLLGLLGYHYTSDDRRLCNLRLLDLLRST